MTELDYEITPVESLGEQTVSEMYALYRRYYDGTSDSLFRGDLAEKDLVVLLRDEAARIQGFSTTVVTEHMFEGSRLRAFFSGDTVVDEQYWGQQTLSTAWFKLTGGIKAADPGSPLYWFLLVKGHRTYRYLRAFFNVFSPAYDRETLPREKALMDMLARDRFAEAYDSERGLISFPTSHGHLDSSLADIPAKDRKRPDVVYFLERNPGYVRGDELVCLTELVSDNLKPLARRLFEEGMRVGI